jgi:hypothetical protein
LINFNIYPVSKEELITRNKSTGMSVVSLSSESSNLSYNLF